jgi:hypothetical protein
MKFTSDRPYGDPEKAARKLIEIANSIEPAQEGRIAVSARSQGLAGRIQGRPRSGDCSRLAMAT